VPFAFCAQAHGPRSSPLPSCGGGEMIVSRGAVGATACGEAAKGAGEGECSSTVGDGARDGGKADGGDMGRG